MWGQGKKISEPSAQFCCEHETALKNSLWKKKKPSFFLSNLQYDYMDVRNREKKENVAYNLIFISF